jgi:hypothetical protein
MRTLPLLALPVALFALALWLACRGLDWSLAAELLRQQRCAEALARRGELIRDCEAEKGRVAAELVGGRLALAEAADAVACVNAAVKADDPAGGHFAPAGGRELWLQVLRWVALTASGNPELPKALARLEGEFWRRFGGPPQGYGEGEAGAGATGGRSDARVGPPFRGT